ncbi:hypothetical protein E2C01_066809 [Portunus trituberculatus]|uniref:Uncharacterized protein n=1 Tax=Portunus trituberculatus TaxID=210409 RepID=A0A5B7HJ59_PORTR|nr:hypothetical protein [Portunus trituberculatus]
MWSTRESADGHVWSIGVGNCQGRGDTTWALSTLPTRAMYSTLKRACGTATSWRQTAYGKREISLWRTISSKSRKPVLRSPVKRVRLASGSR